MHLGRHCIAHGDMQRLHACMHACRSLEDSIASQSDRQHGSTAAASGPAARAGPAPSQTGTQPAADTQVRLGLGLGRQWVCCGFMGCSGLRAAVAAAAAAISSRSSSVLPAAIAHDKAQYMCVGPYGCQCVRDEAYDCTAAACRGSDAGWRKLGAGPAAAVPQYWRYRAGFLQDSVSQTGHANGAPAYEGVLWQCSAHAD